jgi:hypothetical protein
LKQENGKFKKEFLDFRNQQKQFENEKSELIKFQAKLKENLYLQIKEKEILIDDRTNQLNECKRQIHDLENQLQIEQNNHQSIQEESIKRINDLKQENDKMKEELTKISNQLEQFENENSKIIQFQKNSLQELSEKIKRQNILIHFINSKFNECTQEKDKMKSILLQFIEKFQVIKLQTMKDITELIENQKRDLISTKTEIIQVLLNQMNEKDVLIDSLNSQSYLNHQQLQINLEQERHQIQKMNDFLQQSKQEWEEKIENYFKSSDLNQSESDRLRLLFLDHLSHFEIYQEKLITSPPMFFYEKDHPSIHYHSVPIQRICSSQRIIYI